MPRPPSPTALERIKSAAGTGGWSVDPDEIAPHLIEWRALWTGRTPLLVRPATTAAVAAVVRICAEESIGIVPQGGNTGLVGGQIPSAQNTEILISLSRLARMRAVDPLNDTITVEAGCTLAAVQQAAAAVDRLFPLSLAAEGSCQIGGNLSTNAGGIHVLRYGNARDLVLGLEVVTADGEVWDGLRALRKDNTGYDLKQLFIGAEGTLGIITAAVLKLFPRHRRVATMLAAVPTVDAAVALLARLRGETDGNVLAFELIPRIAIEFVTRHAPGALDPLPAPSPWYVLCDLTTDRAVAEQALAGALDTDLVTDAVVATSALQGAALWRLREGISESQRPEGASLKHDVSVAVSCMPELVTRAIDIVTRLLPGVRPVPFGHLGDGNLHFNLSQPVGMEPAAFQERRDELAHAVHDLVASMGGSISAEHGIGVAKRGELPRYKSATELALMRRIKQALDPSGIMNPGKGAV